MSGGVSITKVGPERLDDLEQTYRALHLHHAQIAPELTGMTPREEDESWSRRRPRYEGWLREPGAFALLAETDAGPVGHALVTIADGYDSWRGGSIGELRDLAVLPSQRGAGVGSALLDRVVEELAGAGVEHYRLTVLADNTDAIRFYERAGLRTVTLQMQGPTSPRRATNL